MSEASRLKQQIHSNGSHSAFTQAVTAVTQEVLQTHGKAAAASSLLAAATDLGLLSALREQLSTLKGSK